MLRRNFAVGQVEGFAGRGNLPGYFRHRRVSVPLRDPGDQRGVVNFPAPDDGPADYNADMALLRHHTVKEGKDRAPISEERTEMGSYPSHHILYL